VDAVPPARPARPRRPLRSRLGRLALAAACVLLALAGLVVAAVEAASYLIDLPAELARPEQSLRLLDRKGRLLREVRSGRETRARPVPLDELSRHVVPATLAAEDRRFWSHGGVDVLAVGRAVAQNLFSAEVVSGASTITMQLARLLRGGDRTLDNKFLEAALARKLERTFDKRRILEEYLNRAPYGNGIQGIEAAAWGYFRKSARDLSLGEAAALAALPRSPHLYDPYRRRANLLARRDRVLDRMLRFGWIGESDRRRARAAPLRIHPPLRRFEAPHFVEGLLARHDPRLTGTVRTTLDLDLQRRVETIVERVVAELRDRGGNDAAVVVLDNAGGDVLAYVGSADFFDPDAGQVDGALARRQPGSALKPLTYALAFESGFTPAAVLPDVASTFPTAAGELYEPRNYDGKFHGPVRAREALANSYNIPAVWLAQQLTPERLLETYRAFGLTMLDRPADYYGVALTLGDGEVTLLALTTAYAALARGGVLLPARMLADEEPPAAAPRVVRAATAFLVTDVLADRRARLAAFGEGNVLELPFRAAAKTGTSKSYRDNWTVGYTREVTVGVWVGNFSGEPMGNVSGITGAGPLFREVLLAAMEGRKAEPWQRPAGLVDLRICPLSGEPAGPECPHAVTEPVPEALARRAAGTCTWHRRLAVDRRNGLLAGPECPPELVDRPLFESFPAAFAAWAADAGRPVPPTADSPFCPPLRESPGTDGAPDGALRPVVLAWPEDGSRFSLDPDVPPELQTIAIVARVPGADPVARVTFLVDGRVLGEAAAPFRAAWRLEPGRHELTVRLPDGAEDRATIEVF
jgi:penicillin-binding protein 1C